MAMLVDLCDAMAKKGDEHFFSALMKLGIIREILKKGSGYCKDIALTARKHGHNELAEIIATSSRYIRITIVLSIGFVLQTL